MLKNIQKYFSSHRTAIILLLAIIFISLFFRLYKISDYMTFLGDEGRDAIVARDILRGDLTLLGPRASAGDFFLGPAYYYMIAPFLLLSGYDPVGPAIMVALFGVATVVLIYFAGEKFFSIRAGLVASSLYAISPLVVAYSRSSWNPNLMPFFSLLILFLMVKAVANQSVKLFLIIGFLIGIAIQLHYLSTFLGVIVFVFLILGEIIFKKKDLLIRYLSHGALLFLGFTIGLSPFILFEIRHGFPNILTIFSFIFEDNSSKPYSINQTFWGNISDVFFRLFARLITKFPPSEQIKTFESNDLLFMQMTAIIIAICSIITIVKVRDKLVKLLLICWLFFGVFLFGFYKQPIYDYYLGFIFPLPFLLVGNFISLLSTNNIKRKLGIGMALIIFSVLVILNLTGAPFLNPANRQKDQAKNIADFILSKTEGKAYNFALLTKGNSDHVYRYFLETANRAPVTMMNTIIDPQRKTVTNQLIVVCEYSDCQPLGSPLWEVAGFGRAEIIGVWEVPHVTIYKLIHYDES